MKAKTMNNNDAQYLYLVLPATATLIRFINIERAGGRVCTEVYTLDGECECVQHVKWLTKSVFGNIMLLPMPSLLIIFYSLKFMCLNMGIGVLIHA